VGGDYERLLCSWINVNCPQNFFNTCRTRHLLDACDKLDETLDPSTYTDAKYNEYLFLMRELDNQCDKPCNLELATGKNLEHRMPPR
jgi:hypothetical protein